MILSTIAALATSPGVGGIGIIRLSGDEAKSIVSRIFKPYKLKDFDSAISRKLYYGHIVDPKSGRSVDEVLCVWMKAPTTYTGEDIVEIQGHGGYIPLQEIIKLCLASGAEIAEAGEFTKRAFLNGRIDLTQAEAVMDLIQAKSVAAGQLAMRQLQGALGEQISMLTAATLKLLAILEAWIDFSEDIGDFDSASFKQRLEELISSLETLLAAARGGRILRQGVRTTIAGLPNVGKSSLLNALLDYDRAIVSEFPGTTRDVLEEAITIEGLAFILRDTAGLRESADPVESLGIERSKNALADAELVLLVLDGSRKLCEEEEKLLAELYGMPLVIVLNKADLPCLLDIIHLKTLLPKDAPLVFTAANISRGIIELQSAIAGLIPQVLGGSMANESELFSKQRHIEAVSSALFHLKEATKTLESGMPHDYLAVDLSTAWTHLATINGEAVSSDLVEEIFREFCIGK